MKDIVGSCIHSGVALFCPQVMVYVVIVEYFVTMLDLTHCAHLKLHEALDRMHTSLWEMSKLCFVVAAVLGLISSSAVVHEAGQEQNKCVVRIVSVDQFENGQPMTFEQVFEEQFDEVYKRILALFLQHRFIDDLTSCNCEHFAMWVLTGKATSDQAVCTAQALGGVGGVGASTAVTMATIGITYTTLATVLGSQTIAVNAPWLVPSCGSAAIALLSPQLVAGVIVMVAVSTKIAVAVSRKVHRSQVNGESGGQGQFDRALCSPTHAFDDQEEVLQRIQLANLNLLRNLPS